MAEHQRKLVAEQLARKERLAKELRAEKGRLEAMKKELQSLARPPDSSISPQVGKIGKKNEFQILPLRSPLCLLLHVGTEEKITKRNLPIANRMRQTCRRSGSMVGSTR